MKKIIKPHQREEAVFYTDFRGICTGENVPPVEIIFSFNYGSKYDGAFLSLQLTDEENQDILDLIKSKISKEKIEEMKKELDDEHTRDFHTEMYRSSTHCIAEFFES